MAKQIRNLGKVVSILVAASRVEDGLHDDVDAFHAPSECHSLVSKGEAVRLRAARRHAEALARAPYRIILKQLRRRVSAKWLANYQLMSLNDRSAI